MQLEFKWRKIKCGRRPEADNGNCNYLQFELVSTRINVCFWRAFRVLHWGIFGVLLRGALGTRKGVLGCVFGFSWLEDLPKPLES